MLVTSLEQEQYAFKIVPPVRKANAILSVVALLLTVCMLLQGSQYQHQANSIKPAQRR